MLIRTDERGCVKARLYPLSGVFQTTCCKKRKVLGVSVRVSVIKISNYLLKSHHVCEGFYLTKYFRHQDTKTPSLIIINIYCLCLGAFVAILSGLSGLGLDNRSDPTLPEYLHRAGNASHSPGPISSRAVWNPARGLHCGGIR